MCRRVVCDVTISVIRRAVWSSLPLSRSSITRHFGGDPASWLALQSAYDLKTLPSLAEIEREVRPRAA